MDNVDPNGSEDEACGIDCIMENFTTQSNRHSPMELTPVIRCVLQYLNVDDVKVCRLLSNDWSSEGLIILKRRSKIVFKKDSNGAERTPCQFLELFPDFEQAIPFTAFQIVGFGHREWKVSELDAFFERQRNSIREVELYCLTLFKDVGVVDHNFNISSWLSNSAMTNPNAKYHTKLSVLCKEEHDHCMPTLLSVDVSTIANVKELTFDYSHFQLNLQDGIKINPTKLKFHQTACAKHGNKLTNFSINEFVNLHKIKKMDIYSNSVAETAVIMDMSGNNGLDIEYLSLYGVKTTNFGNCNWKVETLNLCGSSFQQRTEMAIKEFYFVVQDASIIDFSVLPPTIEKLAVVAFHRPWLCSESIFLPNLNSLYLRGGFQSILPSFTKYSIVDLRLVGPFEIQFDWIPKSVRTLDLQHVTVRVKPEDKTLKLEKLVLRVTDLEFRYKQIKEHLYDSHFMAETLVLPLVFEMNPGERFFEFLRSYKNCLDSHQRFSIGPFVKNDDEDFDHSTLANFVDLNSNYYLFENKNGKAIDKTTFQNLERVGPVDTQQDAHLQNLF